ncbi:TPA: hypothetical protein ACF2DD_002161 [Clostridium perfringens]|uniref:hypothetical protein n=1 Tax=Clostridium perfringens TaxID=1502 RepID=UPI00096AADE4|nr:hypothetical protein [Clostridium perfringens]MDM0587798.1 hypothetical protein [Clostridium perfringens]
MRKNDLGDQNKIILLLASFGVSTAVVILLSIINKLLVSMFSSVGITIIISIITFIVTFLALNKRGFKYE